MLINCQILSNKNLIKFFQVIFFLMILAAALIGIYGAQQIFSTTFI
jgi:hypothetical protein